MMMKRTSHWCTLSALPSVPAIRQIPPHNNGDHHDDNDYDDDQDDYDDGDDDYDDDQSERIPVEA